MAALKKVEKDKDKTFNELVKFARLQSENMCIRSVDNYLSYLADIIKAVLSKRPVMLKSDEQVRLDDVFQFTSFNDLTSFLIDRKVTRLAFTGITGLEEFIAQRTNMPLAQDDAQRSLLMVAVELRNIYSHTRGLVSEITLNRLRDIEHGLTIQKGKRFVADYDTLIPLTNNLILLARQLDKVMTQKFKLRRKRFSTWGKGAGESIKAQPVEE